MSRSTPLVARPDRARLDRLAADGFLTAWPINVRDTLYVVTDRGRKAREARVTLSLRRGRILTTLT
jgi:hypothetical protein